MTMAEAKSHLEEQGFSGTVVGDAEDDALVTVQVPSPGASIPKEGMVALYTEEPRYRNVCGGSTLHRL